MPQVKDFLDKYITVPGRERGPMSEEQLLEMIESGEMFGAGLVSAEISQEQMDTDFKELGPFVCKKVITFDMLSPQVQQQIKDTGRSTEDREMLIDCCEAEELFVTSELLRWYLSKGVCVRRVISWFEYLPTKTGQVFIDKVTTHRRKADESETTRQIANMWKLSGPSPLVHSLSLW